MASTYTAAAPARGDPFVRRSTVLCQPALLGDLAHAEVANEIDIGLVQRDPCPRGPEVVRASSTADRFTSEIFDGALGPKTKRWSASIARSLPTVANGSGYEGSGSRRNGYNLI